LHGQSLEKFKKPAGSVRNFEIDELSFETQTGLGLARRHPVRDRATSSANQPEAITEARLIGNFVGGGSEPEHQPASSGDTAQLDQGSRGPGDPDPVGQSMVAQTELDPDHCCCSSQIAVVIEVKKPYTRAHDLGKVELSGRTVEVDEIETALCARVVEGPWLLGAIVAPRREGDGREGLRLRRQPRGWQPSDRGATLEMR
jgi:hypothetical protein